MTSDSGTFTVDPAPLDHFTIGNPGTQTAGADFDVNVAALDPYGNAADG